MPLCLSAGLPVGLPACFSVSNYQITKIMKPKEMGIHPGISDWEKEGHLPEERKETSHGSNNLSDHLTG